MRINKIENQELLIQFVENKNENNRYIEYYMKILRSFVYNINPSILPHVSQDLRRRSKDKIYHSFCIRYKRYSDSLRNVNR